MRTALITALLTTALTVARQLAGAQGYDSRWNPNYRPPVSAAPGNASADQLWQAAVIYLNRNDYRDAFPYVQRCAQMNDVHCNAEMGVLYQSNDIGPENDRLAAQWFARAAAQGHRAAEYELGAMYEEGEGGVPRNAAKAIALYRASAAQGFQQADLILAVDSELGEGLPRSRPNAIAYARLAGGEFGNLLVQVLSNPRTPSFSDEMQLGRYLASVGHADFARSWAAAMAPYSKPGMGGTSMERIRIEQWGRSGGGGEPIGPEPE
jgi:hypothetical protein